MISTTPAVVLSRRAFGESDRIATLYTRDLGRVSLRFIGVLKSRSKLKALSEPMVSGEYRYHLKGWSELGRCIGGSLESVYPMIRSGYESACRGLYLCELMEKMTPERDPQPAKFALLKEALACLEARDSRWVPPAYALRLLDLSGLRPPDPESAAMRVLWPTLLDAPLSEAAALPDDGPAIAAVRRLAEQHIENQINRPLKSAAFVS